jgi:hypothetical protein
MEKKYRKKKKENKFNSKLSVFCTYAQTSSTEQQHTMPHVPIPCHIPQLWVARRIANTVQKLIILKNKSLILKKIWTNMF